MAPKDEFSSLLKDLFRDSHLIQETTIRYQQEAKQLQEISVNAAIAAGHCGDQSKVFTEIAKQISSIAIALTESINRIQVHTGFTTEQMLKAIVLVMQRQKFIESSQRIEDSANLSKVKEVRKFTDAEIQDLFEDVKDRLIFLGPENEKIRILMNRIWSITTNLKIIANMDERGDGHFYLSIAESLSSISLEMSELGVSMYQTLCAVKENLEVGFTEVRGSRHAA